MIRASSYALNSIPGHRLSSSPPHITQPLFVAAVPRTGFPRIAQRSARPSRATFRHINAGDCSDSDCVYLGRTPLHYRASMARRDSGSISPSPDRGEQCNSRGTPNHNELRGGLAPADSCLLDNTGMGIFLETLKHI